MNPVEILKKGGVIVYPTETCYGIGCDATNERAVRRVYKIKGRGEKPLLLIFSSLDMWKQYVKISKEQEKIIKKYSGRPVSFVLKKKNAIPDVVAKGRVGGRVTTNKTALNLVKKLGKPLVSTSANITGKNPCYSLPCVKRQGIIVDYYLNAGVLPKNLPTTVYDLVDNKTLRWGSVNVND
jgi:tRNA threonylcarbamoyl adenosine modification protein (Sua5/YciO/YrdC/YwlC family)